jgi:hypothetical protein
MLPTDLVGYPDSNKVLATAAPPASDGGSQEPWIRMLVRDASSVGFYDGEAGDP